MQWEILAMAATLEVNDRVERYVRERELLRQAQAARVAHAARPGLLRQARHGLGHALVNAGRWLEEQGRAQPGQRLTGAH